VALDGDLGVLLPATDISGHLGEVDLLLEELVHLPLNWVLVAVSDESSAEVNDGHGVEVLVCTGEATHNAELWVEEVLTVATVWYTIINNGLKDDLHGVVAVVGKILTVAGNDLSVSLQTLLNWGSIGSLVLDETLGTGVLAVVTGAKGELGVPSEWADSSAVTEELDGLTDSVDTLFGADGGLTLLLVHHAVEALLHLLEVGDHVLGSLTDLVDQVEDLAVHLLNSVVWASGSGSLGVAGSVS